MVEASPSPSSTHPLSFLLSSLLPHFSLSMYSDKRLGRRTFSGHLLRRPVPLLLTPPRLPPRLRLLPPPSSSLLPSTSSHLLSSPYSSCPSSIPVPLPSLLLGLRPFPPPRPPAIPSCPTPCGAHRERIKSRIKFKKSKKFKIQNLKIYMRCTASNRGGTLGGVPLVGHIPVAHCGAPPSGTPVVRQ